MADTIADTIIRYIQEGRLDPTNAIDIVKKVARLVRGDKEAAVEVIELLARGPDGILGTEDDYIPQDTVNVLKMLLDTALVSQLAYELSTKTCWCL